MTIAAEAPSHLHVGSLVLDTDYRHPAVVAREIATPAVAAPGRVECGLGAGWLVADYQSTSIALDPVGIRIERMREALEVMRALWTKERVSPRKRQRIGSACPPA
jgi:alkanesulfonate monooxygenase SsuD/methylene tetrahydromethanopterin reductase-like flavin-dependent oxidoreductase (luciferase family)